MSKKVDWTGKKIGKIKIIREVEQTPNTPQSRWECECQNGHIFKTQIKNILRKRNGLIQRGCQQCLIKDGPLNTHYSTYKNNAKRRNLPFKLSRIIFGKLSRSNCFFCDSPPSMVRRTVGSKHFELLNGIDRLENNKGYTATNCVTCCFMCNKKKQATSYKEFREWIEKVYHHLNGESRVANHQNANKRRMDLTIPDLSRATDG